MKQIKTIESAINSLSKSQLSNTEMSQIEGGGCLFWGSFKLNGTCACYRNNFLNILKKNDVDAAY